MTTQVLMSSGTPLTKTAMVSHDRQPTEAHSASDPVVDASQPRRLPYQASHQAEFIHLQAETEALLERLTTLKQQRVVDELSQPDEVIEASLVGSR